MAGRDLELALVSNTFPSFGSDSLTSASPPVTTVLALMLPLERDKVEVQAEGDSGGESLGGGRKALTSSLTPYSFSTFFLSCLKHSSMRSWKGRRNVCWHVQYLPCDEVFEAQQFVSVLWVLLVVLVEANPNDATSDFNP
ncbi:hypothetical protein EYF80_012029 [Liparis tanakae]|uniref:Uncharacterized protein n=1 Tax=Liparis tanakae TaxID=230148 RepID=A0A4Z2IJ02_9TELE|nr:hypothetical protein EYF80_012029 [Liparis tanakae]